MFRRRPSLLALPFASALRVLEIPRSATVSPQALKAAYLQKAVTLHPDLSSDPDATQKFQQLTEALRSCLAALDAPDGPGAAQAHMRQDESLQEGIDRLRTRFVPAAAHSDAPLASVAAVAADHRRAMLGGRQFLDDLSRLLSSPGAFEAFTDSDKDPLVFQQAMGALRDALPQTVGRAAKAHRALRQEVGLTNFSPLCLAGVLCVSATAEQSAWPDALAHVSCAPELRCTLCLAPGLERRHIVASVAERLSQWEEASLRRMQVEKAIATAAASFNVTLCIPERALAIPTDLTLTQKEVAAFSAQLQTALLRCTAAQDLDLGQELHDDGEPLVECLGRFTVCADRTQLGVTSDDTALTLRDGDAAPDSPSGVEKVMVVRSPDVCSAENVQYDIRVLHSASWDVLRGRLVEAVETFRAKTREAKELMPSSIRHREHARSLGIRCFVRLFGFEAPDEHRFWERMAQCHAAVVSSAGRHAAFDVHLVGGAADDIEGTGWCSHTPDGDKVTLSRGVLESTGATFGHWLADILEQGALSREADRLLLQHGIKGVVREETLLTSRFIHFLNRYHRCAARDIFEQFSVHVVVCDGQLSLLSGVLHVPWDADPRDLLGAVAEHTAATAIE